MTDEQHAELAARLLEAQGRNEMARHYREQAQRRTTAVEVTQHRPTARHTVARKPR